MKQLFAIVLKYSMCAKPHASVMQKEMSKSVFGSICETALKCLIDTEKVGVCMLNCDSECEAYSPRVLNVLFLAWILLPKLA